MFSKKKLQQLVSESGRSIHRLSKEIGVSHTTLGKIVYGERRDMKISTAFKLADALGVGVDEFREEQQTKKSNKSTRPHNELKSKKISITVTDKDDKLLADISEKDVIFHDDVHVYMNGTKLT